MTRLAFSRKEAAEAVGLSVDTLRRAIAAGEWASSDLLGSG